VPVHPQVQQAKNLTVGNQRGTKVASRRRFWQMAAEQVGVGIFNQMHTSRSKRPALIDGQEILLILGQFSPSEDDL